jgi:hypothetical protein
MEHLADRDAAIEQFLAGGVDVGNDQVQALGGAGRRGGDVLAEDHRGRRPGRRELDDAEVASGEVGVKPPAEIAVELLGAIDVGNRDHGDLELHVEWPRIGDSNGRGTDLSVHVELPGVGPVARLTV